MWNNKKSNILFFREPKSSTAGDEEGEEKNEEDAEDEDSVMTIDGVEGGYAYSIVCPW